MKYSEKISKLVITLVISAGVLFTVNLIAALVSPDYVNFFTRGPAEKFNKLAQSSITLEDENNSFRGASQGGVNLKKIEDQLGESHGGGSQQPAASPPKSTPEPAAPAPKAAGKGKKAPAISPEVLQRAFDKFQAALAERDVIYEAQTDTDRVYVSKSFRDNPYDEVYEFDINPELNVKNEPPHPLYPPKLIIEDRYIEDYIATLKLKGVVSINDRMYAFISAGSKEFIKAAGESFTDRVLVNVDDVAPGIVLLSDEFGNQGLIEAEFRKGFQVSPVDDVVYITNMGIK